jgi:phosphate starvation-inducible protein PhoH and related proteins
MKLLLLIGLIFLSITPNVASLGSRNAKSSLFMKVKKSNKDFVGRRIPIYAPRSENQEKYVSSLSNISVPIVFGIGPAGCGKTLFACVKAIEGIRSGLYKRIILTRPIVPVEEEEIGFLPGNLVKKMDPWTRPFMDIFLEYYQQHELDQMIHSGIIEISPLAYMRGRTFKQCFVIADEMQNSTPTQMLMLTTRLGEDSKMVLTGDLKQSDRTKANGLYDIVSKIKHYEKKKDLDLGIDVIEMDEEDIQRSPIVSKILMFYNPSSDFTIVKPKTPRKTTRKSAKPEAKSEAKPEVKPESKPEPVKPKPKPKPLSHVNPNSDAAMIPLDTTPREYIKNSKTYIQNWFG